MLATEAYDISKPIYDKTNVKKQINVNKQAIKIEKESIKLYNKITKLISKLVLKGKLEIKYNLYHWYYEPSYFAIKLLILKLKNEGYMCSYSSGSYHDSRLINYNLLIVSWDKFNKINVDIKY